LPANDQETEEVGIMIAPSLFHDPVATKGKP